MEISEHKTTNKSSRFTIGKDYYFNKNGLMVMTVLYHLKRGECCKSGCLHCPWSYQSQKQKELIM